MRRTFWIVAVAFILVIGVSSARADTSTPTFTCPGICVDTPTAGDVSFPSPTIYETWEDLSEFIGLAAGDAPGDTYTWRNSLIAPPNPGVADYIFSITDVTTGDFRIATGEIDIGDIFFPDILDSGTLTFSSDSSPTPTPEPSTGSLLFVGIGTLLATRKFWR